MFESVQGYRLLWTGMGAQLARDVPFSAICWLTLEPVSFYANEYSVLHFAALVCSTFKMFLLWLFSFMCSFLAINCFCLQIRRRLLGLIGEEDNVAGVIGANFSAGFAAGVVAAGATCPLDVAKTRRQIEASLLWSNLGCLRVVFRNMHYIKSIVCIDYTLGDTLAVLNINSKILSLFVSVWNFL